MKFRKILTGIMASALMACSLSTVSANAAAAVNADVTKSIQIVDNLDRMISLRRTMPMKGDINGDKKITSEDTTVLEVYLNGYIKIDPNSLAYRVLDVNWDGKLSLADFTLMPNSLKTKSANQNIVLPVQKYNYLHTGDFNGDGVVNSKDLNILKGQIGGGIIFDPIIRIDDPIQLEPLSDYELDLADKAIFKRSSIYDLNQDGSVNKKDYNLLNSYITYLPLIRLY